MNMRSLRRRYKTWWLRGPYYGPYRILSRKCVCLHVEEVGHDEHNCWEEYLIARWK